MPAFVGTIALALGLALALYGGIAAIVGVRTGRIHRRRARTAAYSLFALVLVANLAMLAALLATTSGPLRRDELEPRDPDVLQGARAPGRPTRDRCCCGTSCSAGTWPRWRSASVHAGQDLPLGALAVMFGVSAFYLLLVLGPTTPFATLAAPDGRGPLPLLQNHPLMAAHPPFLYLRFIGFTVPFAFAIAALATERVSDAWIRVTQRWTLAAWVFLTIGLTLGAL